MMHYNFPDFHHMAVPPAPHPHTHAPPVPKGNAPPDVDPTKVYTCQVWHPTTGQVVYFQGEKQEEPEEIKIQIQPRRKSPIPIKDPKTREILDFRLQKQDLKSQEYTSGENLGGDLSGTPLTKKENETSLDLDSVGKKLEDTLRLLKGGTSSGLNLNIYALTPEVLAPKTPEKTKVKPTTVSEEEFHEEDLPQPQEEKPCLSHAVQTDEQIEEVQTPTAVTDEAECSSAQVQQVSKEPLQTWGAWRASKKTEPIKMETTPQTPPLDTNKKEQEKWSDIQDEETPEIINSSSWAQAVRSSGIQAPNRKVQEAQQKATILQRDKEEKERRKEEERQREAEEKQTRKNEETDRSFQQKQQREVFVNQGGNWRESESIRNVPSFRNNIQSSNRQAYRPPVNNVQTTSQTSRNVPFRNEILQKPKPVTVEKKIKVEIPIQQVDEEGWDIVVSRKTRTELRKIGVVPVVNKKEEKKMEFKTEVKAEPKNSNEELKPYQNKVRNLKKKIRDIENIKQLSDIDESQKTKLTQENALREELKKAQTELDSRLLK